MKSALYDIYSSTLCPPPAFRVAVTGHRPDKLWGYKDDDRYLDLQVILYDMLEGFLIAANPEHGPPEGPSTFAPEPGLHLITGMALGVDQLFFRAGFNLRGWPRKCRPVYLEAAVPCRNQECKWQPGQQETYRKMLPLADKVTYVTDGSYSPGCMQKRNVYMVNQCDALIAVWDGSSGGTGNCVEYARKRGKPILFVDPKKIGAAECSDATE